VRGLEARRRGLVGARAFGSVVTDRLMALLAWIVVGAAGLASSWRELVASGLHVYAAVTCGLVLGLIAALYSRRIGRRFAQVADLARTGQQLERLQEILREYRGRRVTLATAFALTIASHFSMIASTYVLALSIGAHAPFTAFVVFVPIITIITALPVTWGGLGLRDAGFVLLFPSAGMTRAQALGTSLIFLATMCLAALAGGLVYLWPAPVEEPVTSPTRE